MSTPMRIGFVLDDRLDSPNGVQQSVNRLGRWLRRRGHEVVGFCAGPPKSDEIKIIPGFGPTWTVGSTRSFRFNGNRVETAVWPHRMSARVEELIWSCDVLHVQAPYGPIVGHRVIKRANPSAKVVASFHMAPVASHVVLAGKCSQIGMSKSISRLDVLTCDSPVSEDLMWSMWRRRPTMIVGHPWSADELSDNHRVGSGSAEIRLAFVGRLVERKGCRFLLDAVARLPMLAMSRLRIDIVGDGPLREGLEVQASGLPIAGRVVFHGQASELEKGFVLRNADISVFPATGGESFGMVLLEAISAGCVVTGFANAGYAHVLRRSPRSLVPVGDIIGLSERIEALIMSSQYRKQLLLEQEPVLGEYSLDKIGESYMELYTL